MNIRTHGGIDAALCGTPQVLEPGQCTVTLATTPCMAADDRGLVHGGFVFGLADYAAMLAVNDPNVVLGAAETTFLKPVRVGEALTAEARVREDAEVKGRKRLVDVRVLRGETEVLRGVFTCFVLDKHVLD